LVWRVDIHTLVGGCSSEEKKVENINYKNKMVYLCIKRIVDRVNGGNN